MEDTAPSSSSSSSAKVTTPLLPPRIERKTDKTSNRLWITISIVSAISVTALLFLSLRRNSSMNNMSFFTRTSINFSKTTKKSTSTLSYQQMTMSDKKALFSQFKKDYQRTYEESDDNTRLAYFLTFLDKIDERNEKEAIAGGTAVHGITMFADMSEEESKAYRGVKVDMKDLYKESVIALPAVVEEVKYNQDKIVDWTGKYTSYGVKNQGYCGSCWAFSAVSQVESDAIRAGIWQPTSEKTDDGFEYLAVQQVVSCDVITAGHDLPNDVACYGCEGGWPGNAYEYIHLAGGITVESEYGYDSTEGDTHDCKRSKAKPSNFVVTVDNYYSILSEKDMVNYVLGKGPVSVVVCAEEWTTYQSGIVASCCTELDHAVQVVGINMKEGYWIVKNQWTPRWGMNGYIYLKTGGNVCGVAEVVTYTSVSPVKQSTSD